MSSKRLLALDQGTTSTRAMIFDEGGRVVASHALGFRQYYPQPGWVEHDAEEIWQTVLDVLREVCAKSRMPLTEMTSLGITNQRESVVLWDKASGRPVHRAICWQCRRTTPQMRQLEEEGYADEIRALTGLPLDPYFSASKIAWLLDHVPLARERAERGELLVGTLDSFIIWRLTNGQRHVTDITNASRTMLMNVETGQWDARLLERFKIPHRLLPTIQASASDFGTIDYRGLTRWARRNDRGMDSDDVDDVWATGLFGGGSLKITGVAGDQQAALFGQRCTEPGMVKATYGTGGFVLVNTGKQLIRSRHGLIETVAWDLGDGPVYALEGSVFNAGSGIQWLRDEMGMIERSSDCERFALQVPDTNGVVFVSAFTGLGAPYWDMDARGTLVGLTRGSRREHICRAVLEGIAFQTADVIHAMEADLEQSMGGSVTVLRVDGGVSQSNLMLQMQADLSHLPIDRPVQIDTTALGAAWLAAIGAQVWENAEAIPELMGRGSHIEPQMSESQRLAKEAAWKRAIQATRCWSESAVDHG